MDERELKIVLRARDEASKTLRGVQDSTDSLTESFKANFREAGLMAAGALAGLGAMTAAAVKNAASYEQNRIAFESMLGSADKAQDLLKQVSDFAQKTPFELPQVVEGAKRLLAYNIEAKNIIPTFKMLGDIASGVGTDKLPQLITAFGQVQAKGKLMGTELLQFTEAGVGLLDALVKKANANGGMLVTTTKGTKMTADETAKMNTQLAIAKKRMEESTASGKAKESTLMSLRDKISTYEGKLSEASAGQQTFTSRVKVTREQMQDMISEGKISAAQVKEALLGMTSEGGLFFEGMERQATSFNGVMSNISDAWGKMVRQIVGINDQGDVREGSIFYYLKIGAERLLPIMQELGPKIASFVEMLLRNRPALIAIAGAVGGLLVIALVALVATFGSAIAIGLAFAAAGAAIALGVAGLIQMFNDFQPVLAAVSEYIKAVLEDGDYLNDWLTHMPEPLANMMLAVGKVIYGFQEFIAVLVALKDYFVAILEDGDYLNDWLTHLPEFMRGVVLGAGILLNAFLELGKGISNTVAWAKAEFEKLPDIVKNVLGLIWDMVKNFNPIIRIGLELPNIEHAFEGIKKLGKLAGIPGYATGTSFAPGGLALVGERGPELVNLPRGSQVFTNRESQQMMGGNTPIHIDQVVIRQDSDIETLARRLEFYRKTGGFK